MEPARQEEGVLWRGRSSGNRTRGPESWWPLALGLAGRSGLRGRGRTLRSQAGAEGAPGLAAEGHRRLQQGLSFAPCGSDGDGREVRCPCLQRGCRVPGTEPCALRSKAVRGVPGFWTRIPDPGPVALQASAFSSVKWGRHGTVGGGKAI